MARKGKDKGLKLDKLDDVLTGMSRVLKEGATCSGFLPRADFDISHCARCGQVEGEHGIATAPTEPAPDTRGLVADLDGLIDAGVIRVHEPRVLTPEEVAAAYGPDGPLPYGRPLPFDDEDARLAGLSNEQAAAGGAVLTRERLDAILDGDEDLPLNWLTVVIEQPWLDRLKTLAAKANMSEPKYVEQLIKRQWIASGGGKG